MADVAMVKCRYGRGWGTTCGKPSDNGWCSEHEKEKCCVCGEQAVKNCEETLGALCCGMPLCTTCQHSPEGDGHVRKEVAEVQRAKQHEVFEARVASRKSPVQRLDPKLGIPLNLFELKKGDMAGFPAREIFSLELEHGLMAYFPAIVISTKEIVITTDRQLLNRVLELLPRKRFKLNANMGYLNEQYGVVYPNLSESQFHMETSTPLPILTEAKFDALVQKEEKPFGWAPGLIGHDTSPEEFAEALAVVQKNIGVVS